MIVIKRETTKSKTTEHDSLVLNLQKHYSAAAISWLMEIMIICKLDNISVTHSPTDHSTKLLCFLSLCLEEARRRLTPPTNVCVTFVSFPSSFIFHLRPSIIFHLPSTSAQVLTSHTGTSTSLPATSLFRATNGVESKYQQTFRDHPAGTK